MFRKLSVFALVGQLAIGSIGCGAFHRAPTPVAGVADIGARVIDSATALLNQAVLAHQEALISEAQVDTVALAVDKIGHAGLSLRSALDDYNAVKAAGKDVSVQKANVLKIVGDINAALASVGKAIPSGTVATIDQAVTAVANLIASIQVGAGL